MTDLEIRQVMLETEIEMQGMIATNNQRKSYADHMDYEVEDSMRLIDRMRYQIRGEIRY